MTIERLAALGGGGVDADVDRAVAAELILMPLDRAGKIPAMDALRWVSGQPGCYRSVRLSSSPTGLGQSADDEKDIEVGEHIFVPMASDGSASDRRTLAPDGCYTIGAGAARIVSRITMSLLRALPRWRCLVGSGQTAADIGARHSAWAGCS